MRTMLGAKAMIRGGGLGLAIASMLLGSPASAAAEPARYLWNLATETGPIKTSGSTLAFDGFGREILVAGGNSVRIFQPNGMEDFTFSAVGMLEQVVGAGVLAENGDIAILGVDAGRWALVRVSFRGEKLGAIVPRNVPAEFAAEFAPNLLKTRDGRLYLADTMNLRALVLEQDGTVVRALDFAKLLGIDAGKRQDTQLSGFGVDVDGGLLFTIAVKFRAYVVSPAGELREWGTAGGAPGFFNVVSGIAADERCYYVADQLKSAIIAFDRTTFDFIDEFGYRRPQAMGGLVQPTDVVAGNGKVFVSQNANRGVSVFAAPVGEQPVQQKVSAAASAGEAAPQ